eukprot:TRINITY_DN70997_c0_g1_i1.p1 TRINITY_DN70997_c0_g1~~TRINITY_DN70997_c0_g1_i1.p1  ORF type:complete len:208 (+),score=36.72 TRINITY_DN70997_c0_g1_i1:67-690(+)
MNEDDEEEQEPFCCQPSSGGLMYTVACCAVATVLAVSLVCLEKVVKYDLEQSQLVGGQCTLVGQDFSDGADLCMGTMLASYSAVSCTVGLNVTREGLSVKVPKEVSLVFRREEGGCSKFLGRRLATGSQGECAKFIPAYFNRAFDCNFVLNEDKLNFELFGSKVVAMDVEDVGFQSTGPVMAGLLALVTLCFCCLAGICFFVAKTMA